MWMAKPLIQPHQEQLQVKTKAKVAGYIFLIDLFDLPGNKKLLSKGYKTFSLIKFPGH